MELDKLMSGDNPAKAVELAEATGIWDHILPDYAATIGFDQKNKHHSLLLNDHIREVLNLTAQQTQDVDVRWAALLHDIGKPQSQWFDNEGWGHYYENDAGEGKDHEKHGADMAQRILTDLKFPVDRIQRITHLVRWHMFPPFQSPGGARKYINRVGDEHADDLLNLRWADSGGKGYEWDGNVPKMRQLVQGVRDAGEPTNTKMLAINGGDLIAAGHKPGPQMGALLNHMVELVLEDPTLNTKEQLLQIAETTDPATLPSKYANILDPIQDTLDPDVFNNPEHVAPDVKPALVNWVTNKVYKILKDAGWPDQIGRAHV
jgi:tRNA nucleotidyltransferase (CCA-adding enzyme)